MNVMHCVLYCVPPILPQYKQGYLRVKKECIYEWTCVLSKKPLGQRAVAVRRRERGSFPNTQTVWSLLGFGPMRKAKPQSHLGITSFWSLSKTISFPCPTTTSSSLFKNAGENKRECLSLTTPQAQGLWTAHTYGTLAYRRVMKMGEAEASLQNDLKAKSMSHTGYSPQWGWGWHHSQKKFGLNCKALMVSSHWCDSFSQVSLDKLI